MPSSNPSDQRPTINDVRAAADQIRGKAVLTPLLESPALNALLGSRVLVKAEPLQRTGSFKFRGAYNKLSRLSRDELAAGVVTYSSGNHAQGIAAVAQMLGAPATIIMPTDAPQIKVENTKSYGAEILTYERDGAVDREALARKVVDERGAVLVSPFDDPYIIAGQGTIGLEIATQAKETGANLDTVLVPCGGGGLVSGIALALASDCPSADVYAVEPVGFDSMTRSLAAGEPSGNVLGARSICDALQPPRVGKYTFDVCQKHLAGGIAIEDEAVVRAMYIAFSKLKLVVEPGGCIALAAALEQAIQIEGRTVAVICSGGNVDQSVFVNALTK
jgi:threonine dehydratase